MNVYAYLNKNHKFIKNQYSILTELCGNYLWRNWLLVQQPSLFLPRKVWPIKMREFHDRTAQGTHVYSGFLCGIRRTATEKIKFLSMTFISKDWDPAKYLNVNTTRHSDEEIVNNSINIFIPKSQKELIFIMTGMENSWDIRIGVMSLT